MRDQQVATQRDTPSRAEAAEVAPPGKHTRTMALPAAAVQRSAETTAAPADVHGIAAAGVAGTGGPLPHLGPLQRLFGPAHDLSRVQAFVGGGAADAAAGIGARAYATGDRVAFASAPDLHTAAHEAAHVVQQRAGVHLKGGVGEAGDVHERHADQVADAVVRGESAEALLDAHAGARGPAPVAGAGPAGAVQRDAERIDTLQQAIDAVFDARIGDISGRGKLAADMREIWLMQPRFEHRTPAGAASLASQPRFRAGYDFLRLRADAGEIDAELAEWWEDFSLGSDEEREALIEQAREREGQRRSAGGGGSGGGGAEAGGEPAKKKRRRRRKPAGAGAGAPTGEGAAPASSGD